MRSPKKVFSFVQKPCILRLTIRQNQAALRAAEADGPVFAPGCGRGNRVSFAQDEEGGVFYVSSVCAVVSVRRNLRFFLCLCVFSGVLPLFDCFVKRGLDNLKVLNNLFGFTLV